VADLGSRSEAAELGWRVEMELRASSNAPRSGPTSRTISSLNSQLSQNALTYQSISNCEGLPLERRRPKPSIRHEAGDRQYTFFLPYLVGVATCSDIFVGNKGWITQ
jgi:hypothetical protein